MMERLEKCLERQMMGVGRLLRSCQEIKLRDPTEVELCGQDIWGRGNVDGCEVKYCTDHIPSDAMVAGGRMESMFFYCPDSERIVEVD